MGPFWCSEVSRPLKLQAGLNIQANTVMLAKRLLPPVVVFHPRLWKVIFQ